MAQEFTPTHDRLGILHTPAPNVLAPGEKFTIRKEFQG
ncbi:hypothetical protein Mal48_03660 [Thalassoglobus polymorphus]|uniref:Uncharacterized protein n=1 Tax=Thalassoglobus polymorphus TaxID=2527994 RepID=A0A517QHN4_9PLAN|nr:hypothetical protein Mal48_03660 [Thalassoglobus polymorphus]